MPGGGEDEEESLRSGKVLDQNQGACGAEQEHRMRCLSRSRRVQLNKTLYVRCPTLALTLKITEMDLFGRERETLITI